MSTERDVVLREREAFEAGVDWQHRFFDDYRKTARAMGGPTPCNALDHDAKRAAAASAYPLPKVERPRVEVDSDGDRWKIENGTLHFQFSYDDQWTTPPRVAFENPNWDDTSRVLSRLIAAPTELVEVADADSR